MMSFDSRIATAAPDRAAGQVYVGLGSNLGDRRSNLKRALHELSSIAEIDAVSSVYESDPVGVPDQPPFLNMAARVRTPLRPEALLEALKAIERRLGRTPGIRWGPRIIDIDILLYDDVRSTTADLELPHPRIMERAFVLQPLLELDPLLRHPVTRERLARRLAEVGLGSVRRTFDGASLLSEPVR